jgi:hypothetical protein
MGKTSSLLGFIRFPEASMRLAEVRSAKLFMNIDRSAAVNGADHTAPDLPQWIAISMIHFVYPYFQGCNEYEQKSM